MNENRRFFMVQVKKATYRIEISLLALVVGRQILYLAPKL